MSKKFLFGLIVGLVVVADAVLWLLSALNVAGMEWFTLGWAAVIAAGVLGIAFIGRGLFGKTAGPLKKMWIYFGAAFLVVAVVVLACEIAMPKEIVTPIIAIVVAVALLLGFLAVGGKKWDEGDNQKVGYKNYYQRKAEEEARKQEEDEKED